MMRGTTERGLTWVEVVVVLAIFGILAALALPAITQPTCGRGGMTQALSNMKQLHLAAQSMALDGTTAGNTNLGWPGDTGDAFTNWSRKLVPEYLTTNDFCKLLSAPGKIVPSGTLPPSMAGCAVLVYAVREDSPANAVFLSSANFTNSPVGGQPLLESAKPYGKKAFVVFRKGGDGAILLPFQITNLQAVGSYAPLLK